MRKLFLAFLLVLALPAIAAAQASLTLTWTDNSNNEDGFKVYRAGVITGPFVLLATVPSDAAQKLATGVPRTYTDTGLPYATQFCYQVTAFNTAGESAPVGPVCATTANPPVTIPMPPLSLTVTVNPVVAP